MAALLSFHDSLFTQPNRRVDGIEPLGLARHRGTCVTISPDERGVVLAETRALRMARSVHAYVRGNTRLFYRWLAEAPVSRQIAQGPPVWICGDCHLGNLGPLADADHKVAVQIRDLDQTVIGNPALDLIRLGLSLETAARSADLPGGTTAKMIEAMVDGYGRALLPPDIVQETPEPDVVRTVRKAAIGRRWRHLARDRIDGEKPRIPIGKRFWPLEPVERTAIEALFEDEAVRTRALHLAGLGARGRLRVVDAAYWRKGVSSLGLLRYAVLLGVREKGAKHEYLALVDIKEAAPSVAPKTPGAKMPRDPAERVVAGARALSPSLGERMIAARLLGKSVVLRELAPQDLKVEADQFSGPEAVRAAAYLAYVAGVAHGRQMDETQRHDWRGALVHARDGDLAAPAWLWRSIVDLAGAHEIGYLEHCRDFALAGYGKSL
jgi:uncharacterized protein (DUF2252 family)